jgi:tRNA threonylcarbamoyladenosine biosynthesis protein TsaB
MKILATDTSLTSASIAVLDDEKLTGSITINQNRTHSEKFMPALCSLLDSLKVDLSEIDLFVTSTGPGSFTGIRIGTVTIKTIAYSEKKPVTGINTLDVLAYGSGVNNGIVCPVIDARNNQVYTALYKLYDKDTYPQILEDYRGVELSEYADYLFKNYNERIIFVGDIPDSYCGTIKKIFGERYERGFKQTELPHAYNAGLLARIKFMQGKTDDVLNLKPFYLRPSQAERLYKKKS